MSRNLNVQAIPVLKKDYKIIGSLSYPTKMPCPSYDLPAKECITGQQLAKAKGTICSECYTNTSFYSLPKTEKALYRRLKLVKKHGLKWSKSMARIINYFNFAFFRWHADGDIQSTTHLFLICEVAWKTPKTSHWLATREWGMVRRYIEDYKQPIPPNLNIRLSGTYLDGEPPIELAKRLGVTCSSVASDGYTCPASENPIEVRNFRHNVTYGHCGACRKCWDKDQLIVIYKRH